MTGLTTAAYIRALERNLATSEDPEVRAALERARCRAGQHCACRGPVNLLPKSEQKMFAAFRLRSKLELQLVGFFEWTARQVREAIVDHYVPHYSSWDEAYRAGWRVKPVQVVLPA